MKVSEKMIFSLKDLKADNILVETSGICKISDFGISKRTDDIGGGAYTAMQGTIFYMAPEVINTQKKGYNFKIDIWSVGCVVLEMWTGHRPWKDEETVAVMLKVSCNPSSLKKIHKGFPSFMSRSFRQFQPGLSSLILGLISGINVSLCERPL